MFSHLAEPVPDTILSLSVAFKTDPNPHKVDLGVGVYRNSDGITPIMQAVQKAQTIISDTQRTKAYVGLAGCEEFNQCVTELLLGDTSVGDRLTNIQTPGGSGALRMLADLMKVAQPDTTVWISDPGYVNHTPIMKAAGLKVKYYRYFDPKTKQVDAEHMLQDLAKTGPNDVVLVHGCCHNPTGADMDFATWQALTELQQKNGFTPFVDVAYQGFGDGLEQDVRGVRYMAERVEEMLLTGSCSKNFGLYRERTGVAVVIGRNHKDVVNARGKLFTIARSNYTMPPDHGAAVVKTILQNEKLTALWQQELTQMQQRMLNLRQTLCQELRNTHNTAQFDFITGHKGMFTLLGFTQAQMTKLRSEFGIYGVNDGRINIAGLTESDIPYVANAIYQVSKS